MAATAGAPSDAVTYLRTSGAADLLAGATAALAAERPADPRRFLQRHFADDSSGEAAALCNDAPPDCPRRSPGQQGQLWGDLRLQQCIAQRAAIAALQGQAAELQRQAQELSAREPALRAAGTPYDPSWWEAHKLAPLREQSAAMRTRAEELEDAVAAGRRRLGELCERVRWAVGPELVAGLGRYEAVFDSLLAEQPDALEEVARRCGELAEQCGGVSLRQPVGTAEPDSLDALLQMYEDAEAAARPGGPLQLCLERWARAAGGDAVLASLKGVPRALEKTYEEYGGDFARLLDIARGSIIVDSPEQVADVLAAAAADAAVAVVRVKARLSPEHDAAAGGGYRDVLLNIHLLPSQSVCEVQIHLRSMLRVKHSGGAGGHRTYRAARTLQALDEVVTRPVAGAVTSQELAGLSRGVVQSLRLDGLRIGPEGAAALRAALEAAGAAGAALRVLSLSCCEGLSGAECREIAAGLRVAGGLRQLSLHTCAAVPTAGVRALAGACPLLSALNLRYCQQVDDPTVEAIAQNCVLLRTLVLRRCHRLGDAAVRALAAHCPQLTHLNLRRCGISDAGLADLAAGCRRLRRLDVSFCEQVSDEGIAALQRALPQVVVGEITGPEG